TDTMNKENTTLNTSRREFIGKLAIAGTGLAVGLPNFSFANNEKPAILGGSKTFTGNFPGWPMFNQIEEKGLVDVLKSGQWGRLGGTVMPKFESAYAQTLGAQHCLGVSSG